MVIEADLAKDAPDAAPKEATAEDVVALVRAIEMSPDAKVAEKAPYRLRYRASERGWGSSCEAKAGDTGVVLSQDWTAR